jgi:hypothetical protein
MSIGLTILIELFQMLKTILAGICSGQAVIDKPEKGGLAALIQSERFQAGYRRQPALREPR